MVAWPPSPLRQAARGSGKRAPLWWRDLSLEINPQVILATGGTSRKGGPRGSLGPPARARRGATARVRRSSPGALWDSRAAVREGK
jgi:hypothetical protein